MARESSLCGLSSFVWLPAEPEPQYPVRNASALHDHARKPHNGGLLSGSQCVFPLPSFSSCSRRWWARTHLVVHSSIFLILIMKQTQIFLIKSIFWYVFSLRCLFFFFFPDLKVLFILCFIRLRFCLQSCLWPWDRGGPYSLWITSYRWLKTLLCAGKVTRVLWEQ